MVAYIIPINKWKAAITGYQSELAAVSGARCGRVVRTLDLQGYQLSYSRFNWVKNQVCHQIISGGSAMFSAGPKPGLMWDVAAVETLCGITLRYGDSHSARKTARKLR